MLKMNYKFNGRYFLFDDKEISLIKYIEFKNKPVPYRDIIKDIPEISEAWLYRYTKRIKNVRAFPLILVKVWDVLAGKAIKCLEYHGD